MNRIEVLKKQISDLEKTGVRLSSRERLIEESLKNTESEPWPIRRAKAFVHILQNTEPMVFNKEIVVGSITGLFPLSKEQPALKEIYKESREHLIKKKQSGEPFSHGRAFMEHDYDYYGVRVQYKDLKKVVTDLVNRKDLDLSYNQIFGELQAYFSVAPQVWILRGKQLKNPNEPVWTFFNHMAVSYEKVLNNGYKGILKETEKKLSQTADKKQKEFLNAVIISIRGVIDFINRYSKTVENLANREKNASRKKELFKIAKRISNVSNNPAKTFHEAVQLFWFTHLALAMAGGIALAAGRFDQYMYPFYKRDIAKKIITKEKAKEILACLWLKLNEPKIGAVQNLTVGGITPDGKDGTNELSYLCLDVAQMAKTPYPNMSSRIHGKTSKEFYRKIIETLRFGLGLPAIFNDDILIPALNHIGINLKDARDYCVMGCQEIVIPKKQPPWEFGPAFNFPRSLLNILHKNNRYDSFKSLLDEYKKHLDNEIEKSVVDTNACYERLHKVGSDPFASSLLEDCIANGKDMYQQGTKYPASVGMWGLGLGTIVDGLMAIKVLVYDKKTMDLKELIEILGDNFEDAENLRQFALNKTSKYGNDEDEVDAIAKEIGEYFCRKVLEYRGPYGEYYLPLLASYLMQVGAGEGTGATPDGRKKGEPISDAASPAQGRDIKGPTATLKSTSKIDYRLTPGGVAVNIKLSPKILEGEKGIKTLTDLLRTYFEIGGQELQINVVNKQTLLDAKKNPAEYSNLVVRVSGFNEYFVKLDSKLQDEIISRTAHNRY